MSSTGTKSNPWLGIAKAALVFPAMVAAGLIVFLFFNLLVLPLMSVVQLLRLAFDPAFRSRVAGERPVAKDAGKVFHHPGHTRILAGQNAVAIGPDEFTGSLLAGRQWRMQAAGVGLTLQTGDTAWRLECGNRELEQLAPICGTVIEVNAGLLRDPSLLSRSPIKDLWVVKMRPSRPLSEFADLIPPEGFSRWNEQVKERVVARFGAGLGAVAADGGQLVNDLSSTLSDDQWSDLVSLEYR